MTYSDDLKTRVIRCIRSNKYTNAEIMEIFDISKKTFYLWKNEIPKRKSFRKTKVTTDIRNFIIEYITKKINFDRYNLIRIIKKKYDVSISKSTIYNILRAVHVKKKKLYHKTVLTKNDVLKEKIKIFKNQLKSIRIGNIISIDETSIDTHIDNGRGWSKSGNKVVINKTHKRIRYTILTAVGYGKILHYEIIKGSANGEKFLSFMKDLIRKLPLEIKYGIVLNNDKYGIILDNARIHHYTKFKKYISKNPFIEIIYNVPYSPESNPIEKVFNEVKSYLKNQEIDNNNITKHIQKSFSKVKPKNIKSYFKKSYNHYQ